MKNKFLTILAVSLLAGPMTAQAIALRLDATVAPDYSSYVTSWFAEFEDTGDGLFSSSELTAFGGVSCLAFCGNQAFDTILNVPTIAGISVGDGSTWVFTQSLGPTSLYEPDVAWTYLIAGVSGNSVPEPGTLALLGLGLMGLGFSKRRRLN